jgi:hypothetical protein
VNLSDFKVRTRLSAGFGVLILLLVTIAASRGAASPSSPRKSRP